MKSYVFNDIDLNAYLAFFGGAPLSDNDDAREYCDGEFLFPDANNESCATYLLTLIFIAQTLEVRKELTEQNGKSMIDNGLWQLSVDNIGLEIPREALQGNRFKDYRSTPGYNFIFPNQKVYLQIHPEWYPNIPVHCERVFAALVDLCIQGFFTYEYSLTIYELVNSYQKSDTKDKISALALTINRLFPFSGLEVAMDFRKAGILKHIERKDFTRYDTTFYSAKDYHKYERKSGIRKGENKGRQASFIIIYDWKKKHHGTIPTTRLEYCFYGKYKKLIPKDILGNETEPLCRGLFPAIKHQMWKLTIPRNLVFFRRWLDLNYFPFFCEFFSFLEWDNLKKGDLLARRRKQKK
jgi:hypothetical protein